MVAVNIGSRSSASVQWWGNVSSWYADRLPAVVATLTVTTAVSVLLKATVTVAGITPCNYCFRHSLEVQLQLKTKSVGAAVEHQGITFL